MVTYSDIQTELNTNWNGGIIAKPTFFEGLKRNSVRYGLYVSITPTVLDPLGPTGEWDERRTKFFLKVIAGSRSDLDKYVSEIKRILNQKNVTDGHWRVRSRGDLTVNPSGSRYTQMVSGEEYKLIGDDET